MYEEHERVFTLHKMMSFLISDPTVGSLDDLYLYGLTFESINENGKAFLEWFMNQLEFMGFGKVLDTSYCLAANAGLRVDFVIKAYQFQLDLVMAVFKNFRLSLVLKFLRCLL